MDLTGKNIVYVGGFSDIGVAAIKQLLFKNIANLVILDSDDNLAIFKELQAINPNAHVHYQHYDLTRGIEHSRRILTKVIRRISCIDILVNGAGIMDETKTEDMIRINFSGVIFTTTAIIELWDKRNNGTGGIVVNISSFLGLEGIKESAVYSATKAGVIQFTRCLAKQEPITGVSAFVICPGFTESILLEQVNPYLDMESVKNLHIRHLNTSNQSADKMADHLIALIEEPINGSIWGVDKDQRICLTPKPTFRQPQRDQ